MITSATQGEGKSATASNLAVTLARSGRHVILVDLDLRRPGIDRFFGLSDRPGLTSVERGDVKLMDALSVVYVHPDRSATKTGLLEILTAGLPPSDPAIFLRSKFVSDTLAKLAARCDVLLIDTPPVMAVSDALTIATRADAALILVAGVNRINRAELANTRRVLEACPVPKLGFIASAGNGNGRESHRPERRPQQVADA